MSIINRNLKRQEQKNRENNTYSPQHQIAKMMATGPAATPNSAKRSYTGILLLALFVAALLVFTLNKEYLHQYLASHWSTKKETLKSAKEKTIVSEGVMEKQEVPLTALEQAERDYGDAQLALSENNNVVAETLLQGILKSSPMFEAARESLAILWLSQGKVKEAVSLLEEGLSLNPEYAPFSNLLAKQYVAEENYAQALTYLLRSQPSILDEPDHYAMLAGVYRKLDEPEQAATIYNQLLQIEPDEGVWWMGLGISFSEADKPQAALVAFEKALNTGRLSAELAQFTRVQIHEVQGGLKRAR